MRTMMWAPTGLVLMWTLTGCPDANDETPGEGDTNTDSDTATSGTKSYKPLAHTIGEAVHQLRYGAAAADSRGQVPGP